MNSAARCQDCREYRPMSELRQRGLGYRCAAPCAPASLRTDPDSAAEPTPKRKAATHGRPSLPRWLRLQVDARDLKTCRWCGMRGVPIARHHVRYRSEQGPDALDNLLTLCRRHHDEAHSSKRRWQPVLLHVLAEGVKGRWLTVPEAEAELRGVQA